MKQVKALLALVISTAFMVMAPGAAALAAEAMKVVPNKRVCMVTNMVFPRDQIPVAHAGKTYYGCCENCKKTLSQDASSRAAIDPVTKKSVDKASAVIGAYEDGSVVYFENLASFEKYQKSAK